MDRKKTESPPTRKLPPGSSAGVLPPDASPDFRPAGASGPTLPPDASRDETPPDSSGKAEPPDSV